MSRSKHYTRTKLLVKMGEKVCSKCCIVKGFDDFYATGNVCKECKKNYARLYRISKNNDTQSCTTNSSICATNDVVIEQLCKIVHAEEVNQHWINVIAEHVQRIDGVLENLYKTVATNAQQTTDVLDKIRIIEKNNKAIIGTLCHRKKIKKSNNIMSYPLTDIEQD